MIPAAALILALLQTAPADPARRAVERSLPFIEQKGVQWMRDRKCSSCHHVTFMIWSHREALERGFAVDRKKLAEWTDWAVDFSLTSKRTKDGGLNGGGLDTLAQLLLARKPGDPADPKLVELLLGMQKPEGFWPADGQLPSQRRPKDETDEASTRWVLHALQTLGPEDEARKEAREKSEAWLAGRAPGQSNESLALAVLLSRSEPLLKELLARQNEDGGWSWMKGEASDALATGQTLYVLGQLGTAADPIARARGFLVRTQKEDGSWKVPSTKAKPKDDSISSYWGTAWAAIGILRSLPE